MHETEVRVLLIEDQESDYLLVRRILDRIEPRRFDLEWVRNAEAGRRGLLGGEHDVCLLDYNLGIDDGITMLRECRGRGIEMPVILLTGCGDYRTDMAAMQAGAADFLVKDELSPAVLERSIRYATERDRTARVIRLMQELAASANQAGSALAAMDLAVDLLCRFARWEVGHVFQIDESSGQLASTSVWRFEDPERYAVLRQATEEKCASLPARLIAPTVSGVRPTSIEPSGFAPFMRAREASECGLTSYFAFPIAIGDEIAAVLEFLSRTPIRPTDSLSEIALFTAQQLAHVIKRERSAAALQRSEIRFRSVVQSASDAIVLTDSGGRIISWNKAAERIFGYTEHEILGLPMQLLMPQRRREAFGERCISGESTLIGKTVELEGLRKDGSDFPLEVSLASWSTAEGVFLTGIMRDITDRKEAWTARPVADGLQRGMPD
jgi:PAS domain S-box-containing protein